MKYKRLTKIESDKEWVLDCDKCENKRKCWENGSTDENYQDCIERIGKRLAELEDKIEKGKLIELPCKVGDTVYEVFKDHIPPFIKETKIEKIVITAKGLRLRLARNSFYETAVSSIGKTVFLTREEAEKRLKEMQE